MKRAETAPSRHSYAWQFAAAGSLMTVLFLFCINYSTGLNHPWFLYPSLAVIWWPLSVYSATHRSQRKFSVLGCLLIIGSLTIMNLISSPSCPWALYAIYPALWWPIAIFSDRRMGTLRMAVVGFIVTSAYYSLLNLLLSPQFAWSIIVIYAVAWWPFSIRFASKRLHFEYSVACTALTIAFFIILNLISTPRVCWAVYPIFAFLWWPLSLLFFTRLKTVK